MVCDDKPTKIGDYVFERHEGVLFCYPFLNKDGSYDESKRLEYSPVDMIYDLEDCFKSFREDYKKYDVEDIIGFDIKLTVEEWFSFFDLALHESVSLLSCDRLHQENKKYRFRSIRDMITPFSRDEIDIKNLIGCQSDDVFKNYSIGVIESETELIITSIMEIALDELQNLESKLHYYSLVKLDTTGFIKYYVFRCDDNGVFEC